MNVKSISTEKIKNAYLTDEYADNEKKLKLKLIQGDDAAYDALIEGKTPIEDTCVTANYNYFYSEIKKMIPEALEGVYNAIGKLDIVSISLQPQNGDDPQLIFESLNSTGLDLETADKIRNYVLMNMKHREQEKFYKNYWEPLEKTVGHHDINKFIRYYLANKESRKLYDEKNCISSSNIIVKIASFLLNRYFRTCSNMHNITTLLLIPNRKRLHIQIFLNALINLT